MLETDYLYVAILKGLLTDQNYAITVTTVFDPDYFETPGMVSIFKSVKSHLEVYNTLPSRDIIVNSVGEDNVEAVKRMFDDADATDFEVSTNYDWLRDETNKYLKNRAIKDSIIKSVDVILSSS